MNSPCKNCHKTETCNKMCKKFEAWFCGEWRDIRARALGIEPKRRGYKHYTARLAEDDSLIASWFADAREEYKEIKRYRSTKRINTKLSPCEGCCPEKGVCCGSRWRECELWRAYFHERWKWDNKYHDRLRWMMRWCEWRHHG